MMANSKKSQELYEQARGILVGGVNSPVRSFRGMDVPPPFMRSAKGSYLADEDGNPWLDYVLSWGPMILGHGNESVLKAVHEQVERALSFGAPTELETLLAYQVQKFYPLMEKIRFVSSGTESCMSAIRLARGATGRDLIVKMNGCYHGHVDSLLVKAGSGALTHASPDSAGVPEGIAATTLIAEYNDLESVRQQFLQHPKDIAAVIVEPVPGNMGVLLPKKGWLEGLRALCDEFGALLIFDEVMSGFRVARGGAVERFAVKPDLICLGKVIGGGMPVAAYGGSRELMASVSPEGPVYQAGTLSGNPVGMACGLATLKCLDELNPWNDMEKYCQDLVDKILAQAANLNIAMQANVCGSMFTLFFSQKEILSKADVDQCDMERFKAFFHGMFCRGVYLPPSQYEACFVSVCHRDKELEMTVQAASDALAQQV